MARALLSVPKRARPGEVVEVRALLSHPMETGHRPGADGRLLPRDIVTRFTCTYGGAVVFEAALHPAMAANPYLVFPLVARESGVLTLAWEGDNGFSQTETARIEVA